KRELGHERHVAVTVVGKRGAVNRRADRYRAAWLLLAGRKVERVQLHQVAARVLILGLRDHVQRLVFETDDGRSGDADFWHQVVALDVGRVDRGDSVGRIDKTRLPQRRRRETVGVEGIDAVVLGRRE